MQMQACVPKARAGSAKVTGWPGWLKSAPKKTGKMEKIARNEAQQVRCYWVGEYILNESNKKTRKKDHEVLEEKCD